MLIHPDRLFPVEPATREVAQQTLCGKYGTCPSGRPRPYGSAWYAENAAFPDPATLFVAPDHYIFRMLYSQGVALEALGVPGIDGGPAEIDPREGGGPSPGTIISSAARPRGSGSTRCSPKVFGFTLRLSADTADHLLRRIDEAWRAAIRPRALFEQFNIEVIATTESPLDPLDHHRAISGLGLARPRGHRLPARSGGSSPNIRASSTISRASARSAARMSAAGPAICARTRTGAPFSARSAARPRPITAIPPPAPRIISPADAEALYARVSSTGRYRRP